LLPGQPLLSGVVLALGTVTVLAGVITVTGLGAVITGVDVPTQSLSATLFNGGHRLQMTDRHTTFELFSISRAVLAENLGQFDHGRSAINWLIVSTALTSALWVKWV
jgi:hypothetical protein